MEASEIPPLEEVVNAMRTLDMVRAHVSGFGRLEISQPYKRGRGRVIEVKLYIGERHRRYVNPELAEVIQPAADTLSIALRDWHLTIDTDASPMTVKIRA
jgi:hypothetical protein